VTCDQVLSTEAVLVRAEEYHNVGIAGHDGTGEFTQERTRELDVSREYDVVCCDGTTSFSSNLEKMNLFLWKQEQVITQSKGTL
jgi:hypothetical protein